MQSSANTLDLAALQRYVDTNEELRYAVQACSDDALTVRPFAQGEYNINFILHVPSARKPQEYLLRVNVGSQMHLDNQIEYEMETLRILEPSDRAPKAIFVDGSCANFPFGIGIETLLPGRPLRYNTDLDEAAAILADIHAIEVPKRCHLIQPAHPIAAIVEECEDMFAVYRAWAQSVSSVIERIDAMFDTAQDIANRDRQTPAPTELHIVNTEVNSSNFLINPGARSYLCDWEKPVLGEAEQDLAHFLVPTTTYWKTDTLYTRDNVKAFVDAYVQAVAGRFDTSSIAQRLDDYLVVTCLRGLTWSAMALTEYEDTGRAATNADTHAKIKEYLQDNFLSHIEREYYAHS